jgi:hypothetical protein
LGELVGMGGSLRVDQIIPRSFDGKNPYTECPFYMAGFFLGLEMGPNIPAVIPIDTRDLESMTCQGGVLAAGGEEEDVKPMLRPPISSRCFFGAPVATLNAATVRAVPVDLGKVMGGEGAKTFLDNVKQRNLESYPPLAKTQTLDMLMSRWGDLTPLDKSAEGKYNPEFVWTLSSAEGFNNADELRAVGVQKSRLAAKFNAIQAEDTQSDGIRMEVKLHMLSVVSHFHVPLPRQERWSLSCARNMRQAVNSLTSCLPVPGPGNTGSIGVSCCCAGTLAAVGALV